MAALTASLRLSCRGTREGIPRIVDNRGAHADARANALLTAKTTAGPGCPSIYAKRYPPRPERTCKSPGARTDSKGDPVVQADVP
jgi:hypothetical protein